jgi:hypothetical protein
MHENFAREDQAVPGSERPFALLMAAVLALLAGINGWHNGRLWPWLGAAAALFVTFGLYWPAALKPLNRLWFKFGLLLHRVVNPIVMGVVFYGAVVPTGLIVRAMRKDPLRLKIEPDRPSYWLERQPPGPEPQTMKDQF